MGAMKLIQGGKQRPNRKDYPEYSDAEYLAIVKAMLLELAEKDDAVGPSFVPARDRIAALRALGDLAKTPESTGEQMQRLTRPELEAIRDAAAREQEEDAQMAHELGQCKPGECRWCR